MIVQVLQHGDGPRISASTQKMIFEVTPSHTRDEVAQLRREAVFSAEPLYRRRVHTTVPIFSTQLPHDGVKGRRQLDAQLGKSLPI